MWRVAELQTRHVMTLYKASATMEQQARSTYQYLGLYDDSERARMMLRLLLGFKPIIMNPSVCIN